MLENGPLGMNQTLLTGPEGAVLRWGLVSDMRHLPRVFPPSLLLVKMTSRLLLLGRRAHSFERVVWRWATKLRLVVVTRWPRRGQLGREWGTCDRSVGLHTTGGQGELHKSLAERPNVSLLQIFQSVVLVHLPSATHSLYCGATLSTHLGTVHPSDIEGSTH